MKNTKNSAVRLKLQKLSMFAKKTKLVNPNCMGKTVNSIIIDFYKKELKVKILKSFLNWKKEGKQVKKGEKGNAIWGKPRKFKEKKEGIKEEDQKDIEFFPIAYLFSEKQVA